MIRKMSDVDGKEIQAKSRRVRFRSISECVALDAERWKYVLEL